ncbi:MAG: hypothetical protein GX946_10240 [Oligosphaeraceae bacterium]|nr:hypothetical protein [Oligosphaeraceae bacterium]
MPACLKKLLRILSIPCLWFFSIALIWAELEAAAHFPKNLLTGFFALFFLLGFIIFTKVSRLTPVYVFGHEATHWLLAKLFRKKTGRFRCSLDQGYVEIDRPNVWIILGPYFLPFYFLIFTGLWGLINLLWPNFMLSYYPIGAAILGLSYSYHLVLTYTALKKGQQDLRINGACFSISLIVCINLLLFFLATLTVTAMWKYGIGILCAKILLLSKICFLDPASCLVEIINK